MSKSTVHLTLQKLQYSKPFPDQIPLLSEKTRLFRIKWAHKNKMKLSCRAVFADEASFWLNRGNVRMWTKSGRKRTQKTTKHHRNYTYRRHFRPLVPSLCAYSVRMWVHNSSLKFLNGIFSNDPKHRSKLAQERVSKNIPKNVFQ